MATAKVRADLAAAVSVVGERRRPHTYISDTAMVLVEGGASQETVVAFIP